MSRPDPAQRTLTAGDVAGCLRASLGPGRRTVAMPSRGITTPAAPRRHALPADLLRRDLAGLARS
ncbi:hypothetical protein [Micromonospora sp. NPDC002717]|uniref:hypothetical protein n=1 Tax=Micromonospora sp. NPDC002717 TaxID=3154424 RepID=UPI0033222FA0